MLKVWDPVNAPTVNAPTVIAPTVNAPTVSAPTENAPTIAWNSGKSFNSGTSSKSSSPNSKSLSLLHHNVQSLANKTAFIEILLATEWTGVDILCFSEHWLNMVNLKITSFPNFYLANSYCRNLLSRGGVCIFTKQNLDFIPGYDSMNLTVEKHFEFTHVFLPKISTIIICLYRTPDGNFSIFLKHLELLLNAIYDPSSTLIICGDFNVNFLVDSNDKSNLINLINNFNMKTTVSSPTRITANSSTGLDQVFVHSRFTYSTEVLMTGFSDHCAQMLTINMDMDVNVPSNTKLTRSFNDSNINIMITLLKKVSWNDVLTEESVNSKFKSFLNTFLHCFDIAFPLTSKKDKQFPTTKTWLTNGIIISCKRKRLLHITSKFCNSPNFVSYFKRYKCILKKVIKKAKESRHDDFISRSKNKTKAIWNVVKAETGRNQSPQLINTQLYNNQVLTEDPLINANIFNKYFTGIADKLLTSTNTNATNNIQVKDNVLTSMFLSEIHQSEVFNIIHKLKNNFSAGIDNIPNIIIKKCASSIVEPLTHIFNTSFNEGNVPDLLKIAKIVPLHKKGNKNLVENYRPISLLTGFSKILEKLMFNRILSFIDSNNILSNSQHGFRKNRSTDTATFDFHNYILEAIENKDMVAGLILDLSKAFDLINHELLLAKLDNYGIRGLTNNWFRSYLSNRKQAVELKYHSSHTISNHLSDFEIIKHGVPQGSILGPLLFLIYINDIASCINSQKLVLFADDTSVLFKNKNAVDLQADIDLNLKVLSNWFDCNRLIINTDKTVIMNFHTVQNINHFTAVMKLNNSLITSVKDTKFLGIWVQDSLKWSTHILNLTISLNRSSYAIRILSSSTSLNIVKIAYFAYFHSILKYGIIFWGNSPESITIFRIQKRTIRTMLGAKRLESCKPLFKALNIMPLPCIYIFCVLIFVKKNMNSIDSFQRNHQFHNYNTRQHNNLHVAASRTNLCKSGVFHSGIALFNALPLHIKRIAIFNNFKNTLRTFLLSNLFYSVNDYLHFCK